MQSRQGDGEIEDAYKARISAYCERMPTKSSRPNDDTSSVAITTTAHVVGNTGCNSASNNTPLTSVFEAVKYPATKEEFLQCLQNSLASILAVGGKGFYKL